MIEDYHFGSIKISGKEYFKDVEVRWSGDVLIWLRDISHIIAPQDIKRALDQEPEAIIIGTGESGMAKVSEETKEEIISQGIPLIIEKTASAVKTFEQEIKKNRKAIGLFHLTC